MFLAAKPGRASIAQVAEFFRISRDHVAKVVQTLARLEYVRSIRGIGGGIELLARPEEIRIGKVIRDFEGAMHLLECIGVDNICVVQGRCRLKRVLAEAERLQMDYLDSVRLTDVIQPGGQLLDITGPATNETIGVIEV
jgi:Rrf2 family nitric oxide-sensitive transcriptional repressor